MNHHLSPWVCKSKCLKMVRQIKWSCAWFRCKKSRAEPWPRCLSLFFSAFQEGSTVVGNSKNIYVSLSEGHTHKCIEEVRILCNFQEGKYICMWSLDLLSHEVLLFFFSLSSQLCLFFSFPSTFAWGNVRRWNQILSSDPKKLWVKPQPNGQCDRNDGTQVAPLKQHGKKQHAYQQYWLGASEGLAVV